MACGEVSGILLPDCGDGVASSASTRGGGLSGISRGKSEQGLCCIPQDGPRVRGWGSGLGAGPRGSFEIAAGGCCHCSALWGRKLIQVQSRPSICSIGTEFKPLQL